MSAESPRHVRSGGPLTVPSQPPSDRSIIDAVSGFINDVTLSSSSSVDPKDVIQWARFETADINEPTPEGDSDNDISPLLLILGYGAGVQVWLVPPSGEAQEVLSWRQGTVRVLRILPTPQRGDCFASKRPLIALCDSASPGPTFCALSFISIRGGEQVKSIKFKNPILDVLANKRSVVVAFSERFAVFDAATLEDRMTVTTCYPCPCPLGGSNPVNPLSLGDRWLAYADKKLNQSKRSSGGCEGEGVTSYTATVLHAAKSPSKGLRGLGESVAHSLAGGRSTSQSPSPPNTDTQQPGVVTILDIEGIEEEEGQDAEEPSDPIVAHFIAHSEAIIALKFDSSGMLLVTADRRGHDFHVFRINPHPCGPSLASVHHLYILHRGDTTAKVQDIAISSDSRWTAISTLRGTTHVFAISPYGGACGVRTHTQPRVVNRLSRFHRSAGLPIVPVHAQSPPARSSGSPVSCMLVAFQGLTATSMEYYRGACGVRTHTQPRVVNRPSRFHRSAGLPIVPVHAQSPPARPSGSPVGDGLTHGAWFPNPRLPPYPQPTTAAPLAQLRPTANLPTHTITRTSSGRQRLSSLSEDSNSAPLLARARFGLGSGAPSATPLYLVTASGTLLHLLLHPRPVASVPKEKICDESPIEVTVEPVSQWALQRPPAAPDLLAPLPPANPLLRHLHLAATKCGDVCMSEEERWLSQVEIVTHAGPHRRLWMGPQFVFKTYNCTGSNSSLSEAETVEVETTAPRGVARSNPVNMPGVRPIVPVLIDSGSASSVEHSPSDGFRRKSLLADAGRAPSLCDVQLKEDLAEAMKEDHGWLTARPEEARGGTGGGGGVARAVDPLGTVVRAPDPPAVRAPSDPDAHTRANRDEATFRPVVRAPAALPPPALLLRPLPLPVTTTIPVEPLEQPPEPRPQPAQDLLARVVIPAALSGRLPPSPPPPEGDDLSFKLSDLSSDDRPPLDDCPPPLRREIAPEPLQVQHARSATPSKVVAEPPPVQTARRSLTPSRVVSEQPPIQADARRSPTPLKVVQEPPSVQTEQQSSPPPPEVILKPPSVQADRRRSPPSAEVVPEIPPVQTNRRRREPRIAPIWRDEEIKTEDQAWDMLLTEPEKPPPPPVVESLPVEKIPEDPKPKSKRNRKGKKAQDEVQTKAEEDSFVEIHAIEEKPQPSSGDLVSISSPFEDVEPCGSYVAKSKKTCASKSLTPDKTAVEPQKNVAEAKIQDEFDQDFGVSKSFSKIESNLCEMESWAQLTMKQKPLDVIKEKSKSNTIVVTRPEEAEDECFSKCKESPKSRKSKSLSPYLECRKSNEKVPETDVKDVYVIDSTKEEFPDIQITRGTKSRKKSPQPIETKTEEKPVFVEKPAAVVEKPIKSWSSIAASKSTKKSDDFELTAELVDAKIEKTNVDDKKLERDKLSEFSDIVCMRGDKESSKEVSLHEKLYELCKRTDIVVAECDTPAELHFVEEHHAVLHDLPPLEPLDFALDDFKLEVMRDSLLEVNEAKLTSPICKINIDDILSSIKETTSKVIESSTFNLIDLEKVPARKEKGFSVIEGHKITSQEIKIDDELKADDREAEIMEKSSDDDNTSPVVSTDSDKEDKKMSASNKTTLPSTKKVAKAKNSRRKKK
ncbi:uncharacterized protein LOC114364067 isoform X2 [Ostrinia furnacalis]|uniref:uncharacterized protein LOC114364067 isoform X2 n=1 Tax=Ostrinia furnacalis TaxID=93504 RepID=UPI001038C51B|nr:uncharacterized protein LOC114364067 isoform X2 [Ostrinia furnacalis]